MIGKIVDTANALDILTANQLFQKTAELGLASVALPEEHIEILDLLTQDGQRHEFKKLLPNIGVPIRELLRKCFKNIP